MIWVLSPPARFSRGHSLKDKYYGTVFMILNDRIFWASSILLSSCTLLIHKKVIPDLLPNSAILESFWSLKSNRGSIRLSFKWERICFVPGHSNDRWAFRFIISMHIAVLRFWGPQQTRFWRNVVKKLGLVGQCNPPVKRSKRSKMKRSSSKGLISYSYGIKEIFLRQLNFVIFE